MNEANEVEILLVEDNADDLDMALYALREMTLANHIQVARDGEEALDFIFCLGTHAERAIASAPKVILLGTQRRDGKLQTGCQQLHRQAGEL